MDATFDERVRNMIKLGEGSVPHMYLDTRRKVTVAVGNLLPSADSAAAHPFMVAGSGSAASSDDIKAEYKKVSQLKKGLVAQRYRKFTELRLTEDYIDSLLDKRLAKFISRLREDFPDFDSYPEEAKMGLIDMAFNLGNKGLLRKFPSFTQAARDQDWLRCARECRRRGIGEGRNRETRELFLDSAKSTYS